MRPSPHPSPFTTRLRRGFTLVELLLVVAIVSLVLSSLGVALHALFRVDGQIRDELVSSAALPQLSIQLRDDAHAAGTVEASQDDDLSVLTFQLADERQVSYRASAARIVRVVRRGDEQLHQEVYPLNAQRVEWQLDAASGWVQLKIERNVGRIPDAPDALRTDLIEAAIGLNFAGRPADE